MWAIPAFRPQLLCPLTSGAIGPSRPERATTLATSLVALMLLTKDKGTSLAKLITPSASLFLSGLGLFSTELRAVYGAKKAKSLARLCTILAPSTSASSDPYAGRRADILPPMDAAMRAALLADVHEVNAMPLTSRRCVVWPSLLRALTGLSISRP